MTVVLSVVRMTLGDAPLFNANRTMSLAKMVTFTEAWVVLSGAHCGVRGPLIPLCILNGAKQAQL